MSPNPIFPELSPLEPGSAGRRFWRRAISRVLPRRILGRILAALMVLAFATYATTALVVYSGVRAAIVDSNTKSLQQLAELRFERLEAFFAERATDVTAWSELDVMNDLVSGDIDKRVTRTLEDLKQLYGLTGDLYAFDAAGTLMASSRQQSAAASGLTLPAVWAFSQPALGDGSKPALNFLDKHIDPLSGLPAVALEIPVFARFDRHFRIGTLLLSEPWSAVEALLFQGAETGTLLRRTGPPAVILAADPPELAQHPDAEGADPQQEQAGAALIGRSQPGAGVLAGWQVEIRQDTSVVTRSLRGLGGDLVLLGFLLALPILGLGRWLSNRLTAPVIELTRVVQEIAATDKLDARVPVVSSDELGTLARSFNRMTENLERTTGEREQVVRDLEALNQTLETKVATRTAELEAAILAQHRLIGDISHEIKSPLARMDVALGLARRLAGDLAGRYFDRLEREIENISALASELLTLARLDSAPAAVDFAELDLTQLVEAIIADAVFETPQREADLVLIAPNQPLLVMANAELLRRAIENVIRNALFYTGPATPVRVSLRPDAAGGLMIEIRDHGPGVPADALAHLFEPFYRVDEARARKTGGAGVGLAICQRVVSLHAGRVSARANPEGGLIVEIIIPVLEN